MKIVTTEDMRSIDIETIEKIPSILLMEHVASDIFKLIKKKHGKSLKKNETYIFASVGGNGGDGLAIARYMIEEHFKVNVFLIGDLNKIHKDTYSNYSILKTMGVHVYTINEEEETHKLLKTIKNDSFVIDALYGTGGVRPLEGITKLLVSELNKMYIYRISVDMPSGLISLIESANAICFKAHETYTICFPKDIFFLYNTREYIGKLFTVKSIFPKYILKKQKEKAKLITNKENINIKRSAFFSKREQGMISIIAGSHEFPGASILVASAIYRLGTGYIRLYVPSSISKLIKQIIFPIMPEIVIIPIGEENQKCFTEKDLSLAKDINKNSALVIGSGLGRNISTGIFINSILKQIEIPTVIDADALFLMSENTLSSINKNFILTPHIYEFEKLTKINHIEALKDPYKSLREFRERTEASILLKDAISFLMYENDIFVNYKPTISMGKAGMGDVLAGFIGAFLARGLSIPDAVKLSLIIQNKSFKAASLIYGEDSVEPSDMPLEASKILKKLHYRKTI